MNIAIAGTGAVSAAGSADTRRSSSHRPRPQVPWGATRVLGVVFVIALVALAAWVAIDPRVGQLFPGLAAGFSVVLLLVAAAVVWLVFFRR